MATTGNSQGLPTINLNSTDVGVPALPPNDTDIAIAGDALPSHLNRSVTRQVMAVAMCASEPVEVSRHITNVEDGTRPKLGPSAFTTGPLPRTGPLQLTARDHIRPSSLWRPGSVRRAPFLVLVKQ